MNDVNNAQISANFAEKTLLVTGGTGSFGHAVVRRFLDSGLKEIRIFSRDEKKQHDMRQRFENDKLKFFLGDVRDISSISNATRGVDYVFHAAALKQVPSCEFHPMEALRTNVIGTENLLEACINNGIAKVICLSTDKAVYPINAMGMTKALMEKVALSKSITASDTKICVTRYGNVMGSRGSVIPLFLDQINSGIPLTLTDPKMTRFMMSLEDAVDLVIYAFVFGAAGEIYVQKSPSATLMTLADTLFQITNAKVREIQVIGTRHGEKLFETLLSREEMAKAADLGNYFRVPPDLRDLNYRKYHETGDKTITDTSEYNSHNADLLDHEALVTALLKLPFIQKIQKDAHVNSEV